MSAELKGAWNYPTRVLVGPGRISELADACKTAGISRPLIVTDKGLVDGPVVAKAREVLKARRADLGRVLRREGQSDRGERQCRPRRLPRRQA